MTSNRNILVFILIIAIGALLFTYWQNSQIEVGSDVQNDSSSAEPQDPQNSPAGTQDNQQPKPAGQDNGNDLAFDLEHEFTSKLWVLESVTLNGKPVSMDAKVDKPMTLQFDRAKKSYGGFGGCNGFGGEYVFKAPYDFDFGLTVSTQIYCEGGASELEQAYLQAIDMVNNVGIKGEQLVFTDEKPNTTQIVYSPSK